MEPHEILSKSKTFATEKIIGEAHGLGIPTIWMLPGSSSEAAIRKCEYCPLDHVDDARVILAVKIAGAATA